MKRCRALDTYEAYRYRLQRFVDRHPDMTPDQLRPHHVDKWAESYDVKQTTKRDYMRSMKRCMKWAKQQGYIDNNPIEYLELPAAESKEIFVTAAEFRKLQGLVRRK